MTALSALALGIGGIYILWIGVVCVSDDKRRPCARGRLCPTRGQRATAANNEVSQRSQK